MLLPPSLRELLQASSLERSLACFYSQHSFFISSGATDSTGSPEFPTTPVTMSLPLQVRLTCRAPAHAKQILPVIRRDLLGRRNPLSLRVRGRQYHPLHGFILRLPLLAQALSPLMSERATLASARSLESLLPDLSLVQLHQPFLVYHLYASQNKSCHPPDHNQASFLTAWSSPVHELPRVLLLRVIRR